MAVVVGRNLFFCVHGHFSCSRSIKPTLFRVSHQHRYSHKLARRHARSATSRDGRLGYRFGFSTGRAKVDSVFADVFLGRAVVGLPSSAPPVPVNRPSLSRKSPSPDHQLVGTEIWDQLRWPGTSRRISHAGTHRPKGFSRFRSLSVDVSKPEASISALLGHVQLGSSGLPHLFLIIRFVPQRPDHLVRRSQALTRAQSFHVHRPRQLLSTSGEAIPAKLSPVSFAYTFAQIPNPLFVHRGTTDRHVHQR